MYSHKRERIKNILIKRNTHVSALDFAVCKKKKKKKKARMSEQALSIIKILECIEGNGHTVHCLKIS